MRQVEPRPWPGEAYEVIVVGGGHAGCEAALAAARMGRRTLLISLNLDLVAQMPCNPSIGGPAKGHLVRELDALGGEMGRNTDRTSIQIRMLNTSKGPAVQAPRAQADKRLYTLAMKHTLESTPNLACRQGMVEDLLTEGDRIRGVCLADGIEFRAKAVVITTGTFLNGRVRSGEYGTPAGRASEFPSCGLAAALRRLGFHLVRLQTNTPPRLDARTIDYALTEPQYGSEVPLYFSFSGAPREPLRLPINPVYPIAWQSSWREQLPCYLVHTNSTTHQVVRDNLHRSPIAPGGSDVAGPRYCPSLEDKIVRFAHKESHQFFLEPEGYSTGEVYVQGCFTGLPAEVQLELLHTIPALVNAEIIRPGYAIEYDYVPSYQLKPSLETRLVHGLYHAGQINGTSGYEEAAAQGWLAGVNAALGAREQEPVVIGREHAYLGVMIDDLITREITEPYRLLTSRAEYRLLLRQDNADLRLAPLAHQLGLLSEERNVQLEHKRQAIAAEKERLEHTLIPPTTANRELALAQGINLGNEAVSAAQLLRRPGGSYRLISLVAAPPQPVDDQVAEQVEIDLAYGGYIQRQQAQVAHARRLENWRIPKELDYTSVQGLSAEARERLTQRRPASVGQAGRVPGVTPADIAVLLVHLERKQRLSKQ
ncbi:MAG: tRNA uridine-5-carboxymethylaminomethyl(34) synthesis enzyme MnmG [Chloroflexi bacterium]|nr:tRNA uridine-5-carboxymethylaminomethyl(34) synthesis enzyme MnmG [Chloroflexota bacterium]